VLLNDFPTMAKGGREGFHGAVATKLKEALLCKLECQSGAEHIYLISIM
jgi:hypothetical protein